MKTFALNAIQVEGEVANPGLVNVALLPLRECVAKEVVLKDGKPEFKGAFHYVGYSLFDILGDTHIRKRADNSFSPFVDLCVVVENAKGEKAAFSWGEVFYSKDNFQILLAKSVQAINPSRLTSVKWSLPNESRLVCAYDFLNVRYLSNPIKITVKSCRGTFATEKPQNIYAPEFKIVSGTRSIAVRDLVPLPASRRYLNIGYGHGMGFKGVEDVSGHLLADVIKSKVELTAEDLGQGIFVVSAKDGYRSAFSVSEVANRSDNLDFLLVDRKDSKEEGRYTIFAAADFFVDRNVKAVEKIELMR